MKETLDLKIGDEVAFDYNGSQEEFAGSRQIGKVVVLVPHIQWEGGTVPYDQPLTGQGDGIMRNVECV